MVLKLDEASGTRVLDSSGHGRNGNLHTHGLLGVDIHNGWGHPGQAGPALNLQGPNAPASYIVTNYDLETLVGSVGTITGLIEMPDTLGEKKTSCGQPSHMGPSVFSTYAYYQGIAVGDDCGIPGLHAWSFYTGSQYTAARAAALVNGCTLHGCSRLPVCACTSMGMERAALAALVLTRARFGLAL